MAATRHEVWKEKQRRRLLSQGPVNEVRRLDDNGRGVIGIGMTPATPFVPWRPNGYITSTYTSTFNCGTGAYGAAVLVSTQCVASLNPATINQWQPPVGLVSTGTFANAAGTGDFDCVLGSC